MPFIGPYSLNTTPLTNVTPFTYRDGYTYLGVLEELRQQFIEITKGFNVHVDVYNDAIEKITDLFDKITNDTNAMIAHMEASLVDYTLEVSDDGLTFSLVFEDGSVYVGPTLKSVENAVQSMLAAIEKSNTDMDNKLTKLNTDMDNKLTKLNTDTDNKLTKLNTDTDIKLTEYQEINDQKANELRSDFNNIFNTLPIIRMAKDLGADPTGKIACDEQFRLGISKLSNLGGGTLLLDGDKFLLNEKHEIEVRGEATVGIRVEGRARRMSSTMGLTISDITGLKIRDGGTQLVCNYVGTATDYAKINFFGIGPFEMSHLAITQEISADDTLPFIYNRSATLYLHDIDFDGHSSLSKSKCVQDAIKFGGTNRSGSNDLGFNGYGSVVNNVSFNRIRTGIYCGNHANSNQFSNIVFTGLCGSNTTRAGIMFEGTGGQCKANHVSGLTFEQIGYQYAIELKDAKDNIFINCALWDQQDNSNFKAGIIQTGSAARNAFLGVFIEPAYEDRVLNNVSNGEYFMQIGGWTKTTAVSTKGLTFDGDKPGIASKKTVDFSIDDGYLQLFGRGVRLPWKSNGNRPTNLGIDDAGLLWWNGTANTIEAWNGTAYVLISKL